MTGENLIAEKTEDIAQLCKRYRVTRLRLFGSAAKDNWNCDTSDFDFLAEFGPHPTMNAFDQLLGFIVDLESLVGRKVDVVDWNAAKNPFFRRLAEKQAKEVYAA